MQFNYKIIHKDGAFSYWWARMLKNNKLKVEIRHYGSDGYYVAAKSNDYELEPEDYQANIDLIESLKGYEVIRLA